MTSDYTGPLPPPRVYLTGFMGSGKSTLGAPLAEVLRYGFVDLDTLIEVRAGMPVPEIFATEGEPAFRRREADALREVSNRDRLVVALGGGALAFPENLALARATGLVVYLRVPPVRLVRRLMATRGGRPLLLDSTGSPLSEEALRQKVDAMLGVREAFYRQAHVTVEVSGMDEQQSLEKLLDAVSNARSTSTEGPT